MKFIELTETDGIKILVNIERISLIHETSNTASNCNTELFLAGDGNDVLFVQEDYDKIKEIMCYKKTKELQ